MRLFERNCSVNMYLLTRSVFHASTTAIVLTKREIFRRTWLCRGVRRKRTENGCKYLRTYPLRYVLRGFRDSFNFKLLAGLRTCMLCRNGFPTQVLIIFNINNIVVFTGKYAFGRSGM